MKLLIQIILIAVLGFVLESFFPWWTIAVAGFAGGFLLGGKNGRDFLSGFLGAGLLWAVTALLIAGASASGLPDKMAHIVSPALNGTLLLLITAVVGGLAGGLGALTGGQLKKALSGKKRR